jgi:hypothetical protein
MDWGVSRERLGAELIGARERVAARWRLALREYDMLPMALERCAAELVLRAGAALADGMPPETPWRRCGGLLLIDPRDQGSALGAELTLLWRAMAATLAELSLSEDEERRAREQLARQLHEALQGASAEVRWALWGDEPALPWGGVKAVCRTSSREETSIVRAA